MLVHFILLLALSIPFALSMSSCQLSLLFPAWAGPLSLSSAFHLRLLQQHLPSCKVTPFVCRLPASARRPDRFAGRVGVQRGAAAAQVPHRPGAGDSPSSVDFQWQTLPLIAISRVACLLHGIHNAKMWSVCLSLQCPLEAFIAWAQKNAPDGGPTGGQ